jgi:hypothetical protein
MDINSDVQDWTWGLSLIGLTIIIHATVLVLMAMTATRIKTRLENTKFGQGRVIAILILLIGAAGLLLAGLHGIEAGIWAGAYVWLGALDSLSDAILYSVDSMTTRGSSGLMLQRRWQMMGALEAADGMLLFGISTAFMFALMQAYWPFFLHRRH